MRRKCTDSLIHWKKSPARKPLILQGLRQTGKTWLLMDFASKQYDNTLYINLETDQPAASYLSTPHDPQEALLFLETYADKPLRPSSSLLILDNIQCTLKISTLLSAIAADFPQYHIAAVTRSVGNSDFYSHHDFDILTLYPLDFEEFLWANAEFALTREIRAHFTSFTPMGKDLHQKALSQFRLYQIIGGMPAAIMEYKKEKKLLMVPDTQQKLLDLFLNDISTLAPKGTARYCRNSWLSIPSQLGRTSRKFQYTRIAKGATAKTYQEPLQCEGLTTNIKRGLQIILLCIFECALFSKVYKTFLVIITERKYLFPFRTQKSSSQVPTIPASYLAGKIGCRQFFLCNFLTLYIDLW